MDNADNNLTIEEALDKAPLRGLPLTASIIMGIVLIADGFDLVLLGYVAPLIVESFKITHNGLGLVLTGSLIGVATGGFLGGSLGDAFGRQKTIVFSLLLFSLATLVSALTNDIYIFTLARILVGFGLGAASPNAATLMSEVMPSKWRSQTITLANTCTAVGAVIAGAISQAYLPDIGWRGIFIIGAIAPILICVFLMPFVPESPAYLLKKRDGGVKAAKSLNRLIGKQIYNGTEFSNSLNNTKKVVPVKEIFGSEFKRDTVLLAVIIFMILFSWVSIGNWSTTVVTSMGYDMASAVKLLLCFNVAGLAGTICTAFLIRKIGTKLIFAYLSLSVILLTLILILALTYEYQNVISLVIYFSIAGIGLTAINLSCYPLSTYVYPSHIRGTGVGFVFGFGRLGAVSSSFTMAFLINQGGSKLFFAGIAVAATLALISVLLLSRHIPRTGSI